MFVMAAVLKSKGPLIFLCLIGFAAGALASGVGFGSEPAKKPKTVIKRVVMPETIRNIQSAARFARSEAYFITKGKTSSPEFTRYATLSAMNLVEVLVSAPRFGKRRDFDKVALPETAKANFRYLAGLCQGNVDSLLAVIRELGFKGRRIQFFWEGDSHVIAEVRWAGEWHMIDPTWGMYVSALGDRADILSYEEFRAGAAHEIHVNDARVWYGAVRESVGQREMFDYFEKAVGIYAH